MIVLEKGQLCKWEKFIGELLSLDEITILTI